MSSVPEPEFTIPRWNILRAKRTGEQTAWLLENEAHRVARRRISELEEELLQTERLIEAEQELIATAERRRAVDREAFIRRRAYLEKPERREPLPERRRAENFEVLPSAPPELPLESGEPLLMPP